jgi:hypothetical protein
MGITINGKEIETYPEPVNKSPEKEPEIEKKPEIDKRKFSKKESSNVIS